MRNILKSKVAIVVCAVIILIGLRLLHLSFGCMLLDPDKVIQRANLILENRNYSLIVNKFQKICGNDSASIFHYLYRVNSHSYAVSRDTIIGDSTIKYKSIYSNNFEYWEEDFLKETELSNFSFNNTFTSFFFRDDFYYYEMKCFHKRKIKIDLELNILLNNFDNNIKCNDWGYLVSDSVVLIANRD